MQERAMIPAATERASGATPFARALRAAWASAPSALQQTVTHRFLIGESWQNDGASLGVSVAMAKGRCPRFARRALPPDPSPA